MMSNSLNTMWEYWKKFGFIELQKELDKEATDLAIRQDESEASRKKLVELSREFKKTASEEIRKHVSPLMKSFQLEIDALSKRSKNAESAFLNVYKRIIETPDPTSMLEYGQQLQKKVYKLQDLELENKQLRERLDEYNIEFAEVKNQEVTVKQLKEKLKEFEEKMEITVQNRIKEKEKDLQKLFVDKERLMHDRQMELGKQLGEAEHRCASMKTALESVQTELFDIKSKYDEVLSAKSGEMEMLMADLDRANEKALSAEKLLENVDRDHEGNGNQRLNSSKDSLNDHRSQLNKQMEEERHMSSTIDILRMTSLEVELAAKEKEVSQLVEEVQRLQLLVNKQRDLGSNQAIKLEEELNRKKCALVELENRLKSQADYEDIKRELSVLKSIEFAGLSNETRAGENDDTDESKSNSCDDVSSGPSPNFIEERKLSSASKSLETLLMLKNRILQSENTQLKLNNTRLKDECRKFEDDYLEASAASSEQKHLISQLEEDLRSVNALSVMFRGDAEGEDVGPASSQNVDFVASIVKETKSFNKFANKLGLDQTILKSAADGLLPIIQNQRERFRVRAQELESVNIAQQQQIQMLQNEMDRLRSDNVKLYEKIKFLQGYSQNKTRSKTQLTDEMEGRYSSQYDERMDPFTKFNKNEKLKRYMDLKPYDKITLGMGRFIMSSKIARTVVFFYTLLLHVFVFLVLYKLAYTASCQRDLLAEDWHEKYAEHMAHAHSDGVSQSH